MADSTAPEKRGKKATQNKPPAAHAEEERIVSLPLAELNPFPNHPFKVRDDETMQETTESIKQYGVLVPAIVRPREEGGYEIVAGHRRKHACELAGLETIKYRFHSFLFRGNGSVAAGSESKGNGCTKNGFI